MSSFDGNPEGLYADYDYVDCNNCGASIKYRVEGNAPIPNGPDCEFCREELTCSGHTTWLDGQLDQHGRTRMKHVDCPRTATVYDKEARLGYCDQGWKILNEGDEEDAEEYAIRLPE